MTVKLYTVKRVKLAKVGDWPVERGYGQFSEADIASMAKHAPQSITPRLKIDHASKGPGALPIWGQVANMTAEVDPDDGVLTLFGDYVNVPEPLAKDLPTRLPGRSIEAVRGRKMPDGSTAPMIAKAVALLGDREPSMSTLGDHPTIEGLHETVLLDSEADLSVHAARLLDAMPDEVVRAALVAGVDSRDDDSEITTTEDDTVPEDEKSKAAAAAKAADEQAAADAAAKAEADAKAAEEAAAKKADDEAKAAEAAKLAENESAVVTELRAALKATQDDLAALRNEREQEVAAGRADEIQAAMDDRRLNEKTKPAYEAWMATDPDGCRTALAELTPWHGGQVHAERGHQGNPQDLDKDMTAEELAAYEARYGKSED